MLVQNHQIVDLEGLASPKHLDRLDMLKILPQKEEKKIKSKKQSVWLNRI